MLDNRLKDSPTKRLPAKGQKESEIVLQDDNDTEIFGDHHDTDEEQNTRPTSGARSRTERRTNRRYNNEERPPRRRPEEYVGSTRPRQRSGISTKEKVKSAFTAAYIAMLVVAVAVCIIVFIVAFRWVVESGPNIGGLITDPPDNGTETTEPAGRPQIHTFTAQITEISSNPRALTLFDIEANNWRTLPLQDEANINNRSNNPIYFTQLRIGQLVEISYDARRDHITTVRESVRARELTDRSNVHVNMENRTISVGHEVFNFNNNTLVLCQNGRDLDLASIGREDSINIISYGTTAWLIQMYTSHGFLQILGANLIQNGTITIGDMLPLSLGSITEPLSINEGLHRIVVEGSNINTFIDNISIEPGRTLPLDLGRIELHMTTLYIETTPEGANIYINDELLDSSGSVVLPYGQHTIRVEYEGYEPHMRTVNLTTPTHNISIDLVAIPQYGSIMLFTNPPNAEIFINNEPVGRSPFNQELPPGTHTVTARLPGWADYTIFVTLAPGQDYSRIMYLVAATVPPETQPPTTSEDDSTAPTRPPLIILPTLPPQ